MKVYIYGTGKTAEKLVRHELDREVEILGFLDSDLSKLGKTISFAPQFEIIGLKDIKEDYDYILIASIYFEIMNVLLEAGVETEKIVCISESTHNNLLDQIGTKRLEILGKILRPVAMKQVPHVETVCPHGTHGSPINNLNYIKEHEDRLFKDNLVEKSGIEIDYQKMIEKYRYFCKKGEVLTFPFVQTEEMRYFGDNNMFGMANAHILSHIITEYSSKKIIEIGSGFSSASMLDLNEKIFGRTIKLTFIEPYADRLKNLLKIEDNIRLINNDLQEVGLEIFRELQEGDILFVDSSHVGKIGSDVNYLIFEILPQLNKGVVIHFHDVFYPFEYPKEWILEGRAWNEAYLLRAFLQYNKDYEIIFWDGAIKRRLYQNDLWEAGDRKEWLGEGSIYIQKVR